MKFRTLIADEIDVRVSTVKENGVSLLLFKDARVDMNILDETVGQENWQRSHEVINGNLFCNVSIKCGDEWVTKQDVGTESYTEKEKGQASDSFKRTCFNWGLGRELYTAPFIWISKDGVNITKGNNGKATTYDRFSVVEIGYKDKKIISLKIKNNKTNKVVYTFGAGQKEWTPDRLEDKIPRAKINLLEKEVKRLGMSDEQFLNKYNKEGYGDFTEGQWLKLYSALQKIK